MMTRTLILMTDYFLSRYLTLAEKMSAESQLINALVSDYLSKVAPSLAKKFKVRFHNLISIMIINYFPVTDGGVPRENYGRGLERSRRQR